jgi:hypothetical protein
MKLKGGFTNYGEVIGVIMLDTRFPRPVGDIGNAWSYDFPVRYKTVKGAMPIKIMGDDPDPELLEPFIKAARELEQEGVRGITTSCGFLAPFQKKLVEAVNIPVFASSLLQVPIASNLVGKDRTVGVFTERKQHMNDRHFNGVGWSQKDIRVYVQGMKPDATFPQVYIGNQPELDFEVLRAEMEEMTREFMRDCPDAGAIVLECTNMCPFSTHVAAISGLPVFDINTMISLFMHASRPRIFEQA